MKKQKFYEFTQNNSGGSFVTDNRLCHRLFIEADSKQDAVKIAEGLGCYWNGVCIGADCPCCGDRWYDSPDEICDFKELSESYGIDFKDIEGYAQYLANEYGWTKPDVRIFYLNGDVSEVFIDETPG